VFVTRRMLALGDSDSFSVVKVVCNESFSSPLIYLLSR